jgi:hypothetical protein
MKCEEFEAMGLDAERNATLSEIERVAAREHASMCSRCAGLQDSWQRARAELRAFAEATAAADTPARVEMRLRQEFRTRHRTLKTRRAAVIAAWGLAAAAVLLAAASWQSWKNPRTENLTGRATTTQGANSGAGNDSQTSGAQTVANEQDSSAEEEGDAGTLVAQADAGDFTLLPGAFPTDTDDAAILRVRMQRGSLGALGLPVNEESASEWIQVDLLVGNDGLPQAVRLPQ